MDDIDLLVIERMEVVEVEIQDMVDDERELLYNEMLVIDLERVVDEGDEEPHLLDVQDETVLDEMVGGDIQVIYLELHNIIVGDEEVELIVIFEVEDVEEEMVDYVKVVVVIDVMLRVVVVDEVELDYILEL